MIKRQSDSVSGLTLKQNLYAMKQFYPNINVISI